MNLSDDDIRDAIFLTLNKDDIYDVQKADIVIIEPNSDGNGRWHLLPLGPTHGYWYPDGEASILICGGLLDIYPDRYYCDECMEWYPGSKEAYNKAWEGIDPDTPGVVG